MRPGQLIVVEGISGAGKTTTSRAIGEQLTRMGRRVEYNHGACTTSAFGRELKREMVAEKIDMAAASVVAPSFVADIVQDTARTIVPSLNRGVTVIQDRYVDSIVAYYKVARARYGVDVRIAAVLETYVELGLLLRPGVTVLCLAPKGAILDRLRQRSNQRQLSAVEQQYVDDPTLIDLHQEMFAATADGRIEVIIVKTDGPVPIAVIMDRVSQDRSASHGREGADQYAIHDRIVKRT